MEVSEQGPEYEFFRWEEGEDLRCRVIDEDGNEVPLRIRNEVVIVG